MYDQGVTRLKWPSGAYVVSEYGDGRVKTTSWLEVPDKLKQPLSGKWQGNLLMEMEKERVYTRLDNRQSTYGLRIRLR